MKKKFVVIYEENGCDLFWGTQEECKNYIEEVQVKKNGMSANEFGIYIVGC